MKHLDFVLLLVRDQGVGGSNPLSPTISNLCPSRTHGLHFWPEGVVQGLQGFFLQINISEIVLHKTDQPDAVVHFFEADGLSGKGYAEVDLLVVQAETSATGDEDSAVVERVVRFGDASIETGRSRVDLGRAFHGESFMRSFVIEFVQEGVELGSCTQIVPSADPFGLFTFPTIECRKRKSSKAPLHHAFRTILWPAGNFRLQRRGTMMRGTVRCPYCVTGLKFHPMVAHLDGRHICNKCGHITGPNDAEYECHCANCRKLASMGRRHTGKLDPLVKAYPSHESR